MIQLRKASKASKPFIYLFIELVVVLLAVYIITFLLVHLLANPALSVVGNKGDVARNIANFNHANYLDKSIIEQLFIALGHAFQGNFGNSFYTSTTVTKAIGNKPLISLLIGIVALILSFIMGSLLGIWQSVKANKVTDVVISWVTSILIAVPAFVIATIFILSFVKIIPPIYDSSNHPVASILLPAFAIAIPGSAFYTRYIRTSMTQELSMRYIDFAKVKGVSKTRLIFGHALKPSLIPIVTYFPVALLNCLLGSVVVETAFSIPGIGNAMLTAIKGSDYNVVVFIATFFSAITVLGYFVRDILYKVIDPRLRTKNQGE